MPRPRSALTKLILSLPADLPVADVMAKAKEKGMVTSEQNVSRVRKMATAKPANTVAKKAKTPPKTAGKKVAKKAASKPTALSKSDFIRRQPSTLSAKDVVAAGKKAGLSFTDSLVYMVRGKQTGKGQAKKLAPKSPPSKPAANKADFVRKFPTLSPKDVVAKGKAEGITFNEHYVYNVRAKRRTPAKGKQAAKKVAASKVLTAKTTPAKTSVTMSKSDYVRKFPSLSAKDLAAKAKAEGLKIEPVLVYKVRGYDKKAKAKKRAAAKKPAITPAVVKPVTVAKPAAPVASRAPAGTARIEDLLRAAASALGFGRALEVIREEQARLMAVLGA